MKKLAVLTVVALLLAGCGGTETTGSTGGSTGASTISLKPLTINASGGETVKLRVEIADNDAERQRGLMERTALGEDRGMLFVFDAEATRSFWMKNTLIPLSVAYLDSEGQIIDIQDMQPLDETSHPSAEPAKYALEVNQGYYEEHGVEVGDIAELPVQDPAT